jgi:type I restriction enzyme S subunit
LVGKTAIYRGERPAIFAGYLIRINTDSQLDPEFLNLCLNTTFAKEFCLREKTKGVSQSNINAKTLGTFEIPLPPLPEQRKIASILSTWDTAIEQTRKLLEANRQLKAGLMQKLLTGQWRFPKFGEPAADGELPEEWRYAKLGEVAEINKESLSESTDGNYRFHYVDLGSVKEGHIEFPAETICFSEAPSRARRIVKEGDVLFATVRPNLQGFGFVKQLFNAVICSTGFAVIHGKDNCLSEFLFHYLFSKNAADYFESCVTGSNYPALNATNVYNIPFPLPPLPEQRAIASTLLAVDGQIAELRKSLEKLTQQKRGLMQKLLTGKIRVCF